MSSSVKPIAFVNRKGLKLFGIIHTPPQPRIDVGIIILSPGIKSRVAPHRLYIKMAKRFCEMGFCVLRFDPHGIGDSEGEIEERMVADFYASVQVGRFVNDTIDAMDWMEREYGISRFILTGLCGGAITGLLAGAMDQRVHSLMGLGIPVILDSPSTDQTKYMTRGQLEGLRDRYLRKLLDIKSWVRFLSMKSDYRLIFRSMMTAAKAKAGGSETNHSDSANSTNPRLQTGNNFNPYFPVALHSMLSSRKVLLIFSGADRLHWEFEEKYIQNYAQEFQKLSKNIEIHVVQNANHILSFPAWQDEMLAKFTSALKSIDACG